LTVLPSSSCSVFSSMSLLHPISTLFPYTTLFRSHFAPRLFHTLLSSETNWGWQPDGAVASDHPARVSWNERASPNATSRCRKSRSEEHTSELQSRVDLVCRLLLEKKNNKNIENTL